MQANAVAGEPEQVLSFVREIAAIELDDGLTFDTGMASAESIRDEDDDSGVRVSLTVTLATARLALHVDVNIGDPIWPAHALSTCPACSAAPSACPATR
jgi:hypothetical protein